MPGIKPKTVILKNGQSVCIRIPTREDLKKLMVYLEVIFRDDRFFHTTTQEAKTCWNEEKTEERFLFLHDKPNNLVLITETEDGTIVSMSNIEASDKERTRHVGEVGISILPDYRQLGLGTQIMEMIIEWAQRNPVLEKLWLGVWASNKPAIGLYKKWDLSKKAVRYGKGNTPMERMTTASACIDLCSGKDRP